MYLHSSLNTFCISAILERPPSRAPFGRQPGLRDAQCRRHWDQTRQGYRARRGLLAKQFKSLECSSNSGSFLSRDGQSERELGDCEWLFRPNPLDGTNKANLTRARRLLSIIGCQLRASFRFRPRDTAPLPTPTTLYRHRRSSQTTSPLRITSRRLHLTSMDPFDIPIEPVRPPPTLRSTLPSAPSHGGTQTGRHRRPGPRGPRYRTRAPRQL
jgi:hypothetical protein